MDLHDCRSVNRILHLIGRYKYFFKWLMERIKGNTKHRFIYASSLMYIDTNINKLIKHMKKENIFNDTLIFVTADHGSHYAESPRKKKPFIGERFYYENITTPLIISQKSKKQIKSDLCDSMDMTATFLDFLAIPLHKSFRGKSIFKSKKTYIISENAGSGNADLIRKNLYFTIINKEYKMMTVLIRNKFQILKLFNIIKDPKELLNLYENCKSEKYKTLTKELLNYIYIERKSLLKKRGILRLPSILK